MKTKEISRLTGVIIIFFLLISPFHLDAQQWERPKPVMTKIILNQFIEAHLEYPIEAQKNKEEGKVQIAFSVDKKGNIINREIIQAVSPAVDQSALQLFDLILWNPAKHYGKPVKCTGENNFPFSIHFNIRKYKKWVKNRGYSDLPRPIKKIDSTLKVYKYNELDTVPAFTETPDFKSLHQFIYSQVTYPEEAVRLNISGTVELEFIVETSGLLSNIVVKKAVGGGCTEEAIRVIQLTNWMPGQKNGQAVRTSYKASIQFKNPGELKNKHIPNQQNAGI